MKPQYKRLLIVLSIIVAVMGLPLVTFELSNALIGSPDDKDIPFVFLRWLIGLLFLVLWLLAIGLVVAIIAFLTKMVMRVLGWIMYEDWNKFD